MSLKDIIDRFNDGLGIIGGKEATNFFKDKFGENIWKIRQMALISIFNVK